MKKWSLIIAMSPSMLFLSCTTYTKVAVSLEAAVDRGKVKVENNLGSKVVYDNIEYSDYKYFGIKGNNKTTLDQQEVSRVYLAEGKIHKVKITMYDSPAKITGYLFDVTDTTLIVSSSKSLMDNKPSIKLNTISVPVSSIKKLRLRKKGSIGKGYIIGTSIGVGSGIIIGLAASGTGFEVFAIAGTLGIIGSLVGTPIGAISGKRYRIEGNQDTFDALKSTLKASSIANK